MTHANNCAYFRTAYFNEQCVIGLLIASSAYWTWRLREKLTDSAPRATQESLRLWFAWALLGIAPTVIFFVAMYQSTVVMPSRFVERLNRSLKHYHVAYSAEVGEMQKRGRLYYLWNEKVGRIEKW